jgi:hypothetical protein
LPAEYDTVAAQIASELGPIVLPADQYLAAAVEEFRTT